MALNAVTLSSGELYDTANNKLVVKFAKADVALSQTNQTLVALVAAKKIRVLSLLLSAAGAANTSIVFNSASGVISQTFLLTTNGQFCAGFNPNGHFETTAGEALRCTTGSGGQVGVSLTYVEVA